MPLVPEVDVLLATYNGEKYIEEFLISLSEQKNCKINLFVSDDGSEDSTIPIVLKYQDSFNNFYLMEGPKLGPMQNFFFLMKNSKAAFVALADQDDIWMENHLEISTTRLQGEDSPCLTFSSVAQFTVNPINFQIWPTSQNQPKFPSILFENIGRGCTFVMNSTARDLVNAFQPQNAIMHDWWILLRVLLHGKVIFSPTPEIFYRIHDTNFIGLGNRGVKSVLKTLGSGKIQTLQQVRELSRASTGEIKSKEQFDLSGFLSRLDCGLFQRIRLAGSINLKFREKAFDDFRFRIIIIFLPILNRRAKLLK